jgi:hypothetical protein
MRVEQFVQAVKMQTSDAAVSGAIAVMRRPPGRKPKENDVRLSKWFNELSVNDQQLLQQALKEAAELAIFEFFCILDGVTAIEDNREKGELELHFVKGAEKTRLNDPVGEELHNIYNRMCEPTVPAPMQNPELAPGDSGEASQLKGRLRLGDEMDIHHVPDKHISIGTVRGYEPETAPAIALRKHEHRKIKYERKASP